MSSEALIPANSMSASDSGDGEPKRLFYLDWLRVLLIVGVFTFHALHPFDALLDWHIKNPERSGAVTAILLLINPWGMSLFFLVAGVASKFALRRRSNRQYVGERVTRLLIPFLVGSILLTPPQLYLEAVHKGSFGGSFLSFIPELLASIASAKWLTPHIFVTLGVHLWFLGFLFLASLLALPVFRWFQGDAGKSLIAWLARLVDRRGGMLLFILPLMLARVLIQPFDRPQAHGWLDFVFYSLFFISGYIIYSDDRFQSAIRKDGWLMFGSGMVGLALYFGIAAAYGDQAFEWAATFVMPWSIFLILSFTLMAWGWALAVLSLAMRYLGFSNRWLEYGNDTIMPFYLLHQPVIIVIAFFVVQWAAGIPVKLLVVVISSFLITLGLVELLIRPFKPMRMLFGMKPRRRNKLKDETAENVANPKEEKNGTEGN
ncbi:acyltransferase family protein [Chloroflexota bacterium]